MERRGSRLSRRQFVVGAASVGLLAGCGRLPGQGEPPAKPYRIGMLGPNEPDSDNARGFVQGLRDLGYVEGQNLAIEWRFAVTGDDRLAEFATELVRFPVDLIVAGGPAVFAAREATSTIPIVMGAIADPVGSGLIASLARPGGNVTGLSQLAVGLAAKRLQLLKDTSPGASRVAVLRNPAGPGSIAAWRELQEPARVLGVELLSLEVRSPSDLDGAFEAATRESADALYIVPEPQFDVVRTPQIVEFAARRQVPVMGNWRHEAEAGALMAYGPNLPGLYHRAAYYVDRILKGAKPADLPIEQPMTFDFVVNMKTARELGITFPNEIMLQVTEAIQ